MRRQAADNLIEKYPTAAGFRVPSGQANEAWHQTVEEKGKVRELEEASAR